MPNLELYIPDTYANTEGLIKSFQTAIAEEFGEGEKPLKPEDIGYLVHRYGGIHNRPGRPILAKLTAIDREGRREKLQTIVNRVAEENPEVKKFPSKDDKHIDLVPTWVPKDDWVSA